MNFQTSILACLGKYATFAGRARRSEYWWFYLFTVLMSWGATLVGASMGKGMGDVLSLLISLAFMIPVLAAGSRRLHDIGKSGWWQLLAITGIGVFLLIYWWAKNSEPEANQYGEPTKVVEPIPA